MSIADVFALLGLIRQFERGELQPLLRAMAAGLPFTASGCAADIAGRRARGNAAGRAASASSAATTAIMAHKRSEP